MVDENHIKVIRGGADAVEKWRRENPGKKLDLSFAILIGIDLSNMDLSGAVLSRALLSNAKFVGTNFSEANLSHATLQRANLSGADLSGASLSFADCLYTNLSNAKLPTAMFVNVSLGSADLSGVEASGITATGTFFGDCNLSGANFSNGELGFCYIYSSKMVGTNLSGASLSFAVLANNTVDRTDFTNAKFLCTSIVDCDLSKCIGLGSIKHAGPSSIGHDTITKSFYGAGSRLTSDTKSFFINAGVAKKLLESLQGIWAEVNYHSCFVCYGQPDVEFATQLAKDLRQKGISCWLYDMDATPGRRTWEEITAIRRQAGKMIVVCSVKALMRDGVKKEIEEQMDEDPDKIVPVSLDIDWKHEGFEVERGRNLKPFLLERNYADFCDERRYSQSLKRLLKGLEKE
jgi:uncharacterized protein YjbI with pentapeptide repeats